MRGAYAPCARFALEGPLHLAALEAAGADVGAANDAVHQDAHALEIRIEAAARGHHRVASVVAEARVTAAERADFRHEIPVRSGARRTVPPVRGSPVVSGPGPGRANRSRARRRR